MAADDSRDVQVAATAGPEPPFAMSVDVEDYFQVQAFAHLVDRSAWDRYPARVERNVDNLLAILADARAYGTFFVKVQPTLGICRRTFRFGSHAR